MLKNALIKLNDYVMIVLCMVQLVSCDFLKL